jgi:hypothetical protein
MEQASNDKLNEEGRKNSPNELKPTRPSSLTLDYPLPDNVVFTSKTHEPCFCHKHPYRQGEGDCRCFPNRRDPDWIECANCLRRVLGIDTSERERLRLEAHNKKPIRRDLFIFFSCIVFYIAFVILMQDGCKPTTFPFPALDGSWMVWIRQLARGLAMVLTTLMGWIGSILAVLWTWSGAEWIAECLEMVVKFVAKMIIFPYVWVLQKAFVSRLIEVQVAIVANMVQSALGADTCWPL